MVGNERACLINPEVALQIHDYEFKHEMLVNIQQDLNITSSLLDREV